MYTNTVVVGAAIAVPNTPSHLTTSSANALFQRLQPILRGLSRKIAGGQFDLQEDYFQEGAVAVVKAFYSYDAKKGILDHYATRCARGRMLNHRRWLQTRGNEVSVGGFSEEDCELENNRIAFAANQAIADTFAARRLQNRIDAAVVWALAKRCLTRQERVAMELVYVSGLLPREASQEMGVSGPRITQLLSSSLEKLRRRLGCLTHGKN